MTSTVPVGASADLANTRPNGRRWIRVSIAVLVLLIIAVPIAWWRIAIDTYALSAGDVFAPGDAATQIHAGPVTEYCYPFTADRTITVGFSVYNGGGHTVTVTSVGQLFPGLSQSVTVDTNTRGGQDGPASATRLPVTIHPGDNRLLYFQLTPRAGISMAANSITYTNAADLHLSVLGGTHVQHFLIDGGNTFIAVAGVDPNKNSCDRNSPPA